MWYFIIFFCAFQFAFSFANGGVNIRTRYAYKVSDGFVSFCKNYALSYLCTYKQINTDKIFYPEVNSKLEKLLSLALDGSTDVGWSGSLFSDSDDHKLRIVKPGWMGGNTLHFYFNTGIMNDSRYLLSPSVFILADKVVKKIKAQDEKDKIERQRNVI